MMSLQIDAVDSFDHIADSTHIVDIAGITIVQDMLFQGFLNPFKISLQTIYKDNSAFNMLDIDHTSHNQFNFLIWALITHKLKNH